jgi:hypothetical protein
MYAQNGHLDDKIEFQPDYRKEKDLRQVTEKEIVGVPFPPGCPQFGASFLGVGKQPLPY